MSSTPPRGGADDVPVTGVVLPPDPVDTAPVGPGSDGVPQHAAPEDPEEEAAAAEQDVLPPDQPRPEPVLDAAKLAGLVSALVVALLGIIALVVAGNVLGDMTTLSNAISSVIVAASALVAYLTPVWQARKARSKVTPLADPRDALGRALTLRGR
jgi:hypothetical protein